MAEGQNIRQGPRKVEFENPARLFDRKNASKPRSGGVRSVKPRMFRRVLPPRWRFSTCGGWRRGDLEAASARAEVKWLMLAKSSATLEEFGHSAEPVWGSQAD